MPRWRVSSKSLYALVGFSIPQNACLVSRAGENMGFMIRHIATTWEIALMAHQCAGNRQVTLLVRWRAEMENRTDIIQSTTGHCSSSWWECCCHDPSTSQFDGMCLLAWYCIPYNKPSILWRWHNPCALHVWPIQWIYLTFYLECHFTTECCRQNLWRKL